MAEETLENITENENNITQDETNTDENLEELKEIASFLKISDKADVVLACRVSPK